MRVFDTHHSLSLHGDHDTTSTDDDARVKSELSRARNTIANDGYVIDIYNYTYIVYVYYLLG